MTERGRPAVPQRRASGGSRHEASDRVVLRSGYYEATGWTLNVSRGGVRVVLEEPVQRGQEYEILVGDSAPRRARVVWVREQADGQIVGVEFLDAEGGAPPADPLSEPPGPA